jgi:integrase/recombinase XerD
MNKLEIKSQNFRYLQKSFQQWLQIRGFATKTVKSFPMLLQEFFHFLEQKDIENVTKIEKKHALDFLLHLHYRRNELYKSGGISNQTINGIINAMNCFETYFNETKDSFSLDIYQDYLPVDTKTKIILTQDEIKAVYNKTFEPYSKVMGTEMGQRDRVIIAIFYGCGLRLNEGRNLNLSDIDFQNRKLLVRIGKKNKQRYVPIPNQHLEDIKNYIQNGRHWFTEHHYSQKICYKRAIKKVVTRDDQEALFLNHTGKRMRSFGRNIQLLVDKAGINKRIGTHALRHSLGTHLLQNGLPIEKISKVLGHESIDSTQIYTQIMETLNQQQDEI